MARNGVGSIWDGLDSIDLIDLCGMKQNVFLGIPVALVSVYTQSPLPRLVVFVQSGACSSSSIWHVKDSKRMFEIKYIETP